MQCLRFGGQIAMSSPGISKIEFAADSPLEEDGFELAVPPRIGKGCRQPRQASIAVFGPELVSGSAFCAAVSDCNRPEEPFAGAGPMVRIRFPPAGSLVRTWLSGGKR